MPGWGGYQPRTKSQEQLAVERRRELAKKFPGDISELVAIAAKTRKKPKRLPPAPHPDDITEQFDPVPSVVGPCQLHVAHMRAWPATKTAGSVVVVEDEPYVSDREKKLQAGREYHRRRYKSKRVKK
jgi:hypothetical protein